MFDSEKTSFYDLLFKQLNQLFSLGNVVYRLTEPKIGKRNVLLFCEKELEEVQKCYKTWKSMQ